MHYIGETSEVSSASPNLLLIPVYIGMQKLIITHSKFSADLTGMPIYRCAYFSYFYALASLLRSRMLLTAEVTVSNLLLHYNSRTLTYIYIISPGKLGHPRTCSTAHRLRCASPWYLPAGLSIVRMLPDFCAELFLFVLVRTVHPVPGAWLFPANEAREKNN